MGQSRSKKLRKQLERRKRQKKVDQGMGSGDPLDVLTYFMRNFPPRVANDMIVNQAFWDEQLTLVRTLLGSKTWSTTTVIKYLVGGQTTQRPSAHQ